MDDDVKVEPDWLHNLSAALLNENWAGVGGRILPQWTCPPPAWIPRNSRHDLAPLVSFDLGLVSGPLYESPFGTNMAFRREVFQQYGGFRTDLGPRPGSEIRGEDSEFALRLLAAGEQLRYEPSAIVYHPVTQDRLRQKYFLAWWFEKGRTAVRTDTPSLASNLRVVGIPIILFRRLGLWMLYWIVTAGQSRRFFARTRVWYLAGQILGYYCEAQASRRHRKRNG
jgi:GT2 family glycosyltransferase